MPLTISITQCEVQHALRLAFDYGSCACCTGRGSSPAHKEFRSDEYSLSRLQVTYLPFSQDEIMAALEARRSGLASLERLSPRESRMYQVQYPPACSGCQLGAATSKCQNEVELMPSKTCLAWVQMRTHGWLQVLRGGVLFVHLTQAHNLAKKNFFLLGGPTKNM